MRKRSTAKILVTALLAIGIMSACSSEDKADEKNSEGTYSGTVTLAGSTALQPLAEEAATEFMETYGDVSITVQGGGSGTGINQLASGAVDIGNSDLPSAEKLEDEALAKKLVDNKVAGIAFALVVNKDVKVDSLTIAQIQDIFSGKVTNWKEVGGNDEGINIINRPASSGTRATFEKTIMQGTEINDGIGTAQDSNGAVEQAVNSTPGSISYLAMSYLVGDKADSLTKLKIDGVEPTNENISTEKYPFWSYEYMVTNGEPDGAIKGLIDFMKSKDFSGKVESMGYIPMEVLE